MTLAGGTHTGSGYYDDDGFGQFDDDDGYYGKKHTKRDPRFYDAGDQLRANVEVRGLRRDRNTRAKLDATAEVVIECARYNNQWGYGNTLRRRLHMEVDGVEFFSRHRIRNGRLDINVETDDIRSELRGYYGNDLCPGRARARVQSVQFSDARLQVTQEGRNIETWLCSFDRDTRNGPVPRSNVECVTLY